MGCLGLREPPGNKLPDLFTRRHGEFFGFARERVGVDYPFKASDYDPSKPITRLLNPESADNIVYTERGTLHCICPQIGEQRDLAFQGFEASRNTLKYRCSAAAYDFDCEGKAQCLKNADSDAEHYGRTVRINLKSADRRIFVPTPHGSPA